MVYILIQINDITFIYGKKNSLHPPKYPAYRGNATVVLLYSYQILLFVNLNNQIEIANVAYYY